MIKLWNKIARKKTKKLEVTAVEICAEKECPDGGYGWIICIAAAICQFIIMGIHNNFGILYTYLMKDLKADPADTGELSQCNLHFSQLSSYVTSAEFLKTKLSCFWIIFTLAP